MLKLTPKHKECFTCDYWYEKVEVKGCIFPNHAPIDTMAICTCNNTTPLDVEVDEDYVQIRNIAEMIVL